MLKSKELGRAIEQAIKLKIASGAAKSKTEIAIHFGIKPPSIYDWINKGSISKDKLPELWTYFSDVVDLTHWGIQKNDIPDPFNNNHLRERREKTRLTGDVPMLKWNQVYEWVTNKDNFTRSNALEWLPCPIYHGPMTFSLKIENEAMHQPMANISFLPGDIIFVDPDREAISNSYVVSYNINSRTAKFRKLIIDGDNKYLATLNPAWPNNMVMMDDDTKICGVAIYKGENIYDRL